MGANFDVTGFEELCKRLENMGKQGSKIEDNALIEATKSILEDAQNTTAFNDRTGKLRNSLKISKVKKSKNGKTVWVGDVDKKANYSWYVEYGDSKRPPRPYLKPAFDKNKDVVLDIIKKEIIKGIKNAK